MTLWIAATGKIQIPGLQDAEIHWLRHAEHVIRPWGKLKIVDLPRSKSLESPEKWWQRVQKLLPNPTGATRWTRMDESGVGRTSQQWAQELGKVKDQGITDWIFLIGDADGWNDDMKEKFPDAFSLGKQTLAHDLARVVLVEQLFRAGAILAGHPYHR